MSSWEGNNSLHLRGVEDKVAFGMDELPQSTFDLFSSLRSLYTCKLRRRYDNFTTTTTLRLWSSTEKSGVFLLRLRLYMIKLRSVNRGLERNELEDFMIIYEARKQISSHRDTKIRINWISSLQAHDALLSLIYLHVNGNFSRVHFACA